jgi:hypothetical protein
MAERGQAIPFLLVKGDFFGDLAAGDAQGKSDQFRGNNGYSQPSGIAAPGQVFAEPPAA